MPGKPVRRAFGFLGGFLALFFVLAFAIAMMRAGSGGTAGFLPGSSVVGVVPLEGEIARSDDFVETLQDLEENGRVSAVVVRIASIPPRAKTIALRHRSNVASSPAQQVRKSGRQS